MTTVLEDTSDVYIRGDKFPEEDNNIMKEAWEGKLFWRTLSIGRTYWTEFEVKSRKNKQFVDNDLSKPMEHKPSSKNRMLNTNVL